jgi:LytS/YehU family sensor histidine kinase
MTVEFCYLLFITADYYAISHVIVPQFLLKRKYAFFIASTILLIAVSSWLRALVALQMNLHIFHPATLQDFPTLYINSVINISLWVLIMMLGKMILDRIQNQQHLEFLEKEKTKNELNYLKAQINPHALFNSLNTIYGHIDKSNQVARNTLLQFSELLRYQLYDCSSETVSLEKEMEYLKNYVAFQQLRKNEQLAVRVDIQTNVPDLKVAPLLLIVLIENAFKFVSTSSEKENRIIIKLSVNGNTLESSVFNTTEAPSSLPDTASKGIGIANFKRRLELLYPNKHHFTSEQSLEFYNTTLTVDLS